MTPEGVHYGRASRTIEARKEVLLAAYETHPERFKGRMPTSMDAPQEVWINKPSSKSDGELGRIALRPMYSGELREAVKGAVNQHSTSRLEGQTPTVSQKTLTPYPEKCYKDYQSHCHT